MYTIFIYFIYIYTYSLITNLLTTVVDQLASGFDVLGCPYVKYETLIRTMDSMSLIYIQQNSIYIYIYIHTYIPMMYTTYSAVVA